MNPPEPERFAFVEIIGGASEDRALDALRDFMRRNYPDVEQYQVCGRPLMHSLVAKPVGAPLTRGEELKAVVTH